MRSQIAHECIIQARSQDFVQEGANLARVQGSGSYQKTENSSDLVIFLFTEQFVYFLIFTIKFYFIFTLGGWPPCPPPLGNVPVHDVRTLSVTLLPYLLISTSVGQTNKHHHLNSRKHQRRRSVIPTTPAKQSITHRSSVP